MKVGNAGNSNFSVIRIPRELMEKIRSELSRINQKEWGRKVRIAEVLDAALSDLTDDSRERLRQGSTTARDVLEQKYREYLKLTGERVSRDEWILSQLS